MTDANLPELITAAESVVRGLKRLRETELCTKCRVEPRKPKQRWCMDCHAEYMRTWRRRQESG
jgi:hypothetical protein